MEDNSGREIMKTCNASGKKQQQKNYVALKEQLTIKVKEKRSQAEKLNIKLYENSVDTIALLFGS